MNSPKVNSMRLNLSIRVISVAASLVMAVTLLSFAVKAASEEDAYRESREAYQKKTAAIYNYKFGSDKPFLPSNAATDTGQFFDPKDFPTAQYCGHCHQETHAEWRQSVHSNSNRVPYYLRNVNLLEIGRAHV